MCDAPQPSYCNSIFLQVPTVELLLCWDLTSQTETPSLFICIGAKRHNSRKTPCSRMQSLTGNGGSTWTSLDQPSEIDALACAPPPGANIDMETEKRMWNMKRKKRIMKEVADKGQKTQTREGFAHDLTGQIDDGIVKHALLHMYILNKPGNMQTTRYYALKPKMRHQCAGPSTERTKERANAQNALQHEQQTFRSQMFLRNHFKMEKEWNKRRRRKIWKISFSTLSTTAVAIVPILSTPLAHPLDHIHALRVDCSLGHHTPRYGINTAMVWIPIAVNCTLRVEWSLEIHSVSSLQLVLVQDPSTLASFAGRCVCMMSIGEEAKHCSR